MSEQKDIAPAYDPQDLERLLVARHNSGDVNGVAALYESQALLDHGGGLALGREAIRKFFTELVATGCKFEMGQQQPAMVCGELALTSTCCKNGTVTAEVARRLSDGTWLWVIDQFSISSSSPT